MTEPLTNVDPMDAKTHSKTKTGTEALSLTDIKTFSLLNITADLITSEPNVWSSNGLGRCSLKEGFIAVDPNMRHDVQVMVCIHEVLHFISDVLSIELSEQSIDGLSSGIVGLIKENPELIKFIQQ